MTTQARVLAGIAWLFATLAAASATAAAPTGLSTGVVFTDYPKIAESSQLMPRLSTPLTDREFRRLLTTSGKTLAARTLDLSQERFTVYVPPRAPPGGYGLLVFVPPWNEAALPQGWTAVLDRFGVIYVSAAGSGNDANVLTRREPLALVAEQNLARLYPVDPSRVFVGGFSGGAHVAERLALAYPDIFRGALLDAGADPIGEHAAPVPAAELFDRFQTSTRIILVTGSKDQMRLDMANDTLASLHHWCVMGVMADEVPDAGHNVADPAALARALTALQTPVKVDAGKLAACRAGLARDMTKALDEVASLAAADRKDEAMKALIRLDARFGGLAAPRSLEMAEKLAAP